MLRFHTPRPITQGELAVLRATLENAAKFALHADVLAGLDSLQVIGGCECGCDSVDFAEYDPQRPAHVVADGTGKTPSGGDVGIMIWGRADAITGIEVYDIGAGDADIKLPVESSIRPW